MRMVDRIHDRTANAWADALPAVTTSFTDLDVAVLSVADFTDGCTARNEHATHFGRRHAQDSVIAFLTHELDAGACAASECSTATWLKLNSMDERTNGNSRKRQCIAGLDVRISAGDDGLANIQTTRMKDVALFAVCIVEQCDARRTIRIVFDGGNFSGDAVLVALEIDHAITALHAAALMAGGDTAVVVTTSLLGQRTQKRLFRSSAGDVSKIGNSLEAPAGACRLVLFNSHFFPFYG